MHLAVEQLARLDLQDTTAQTLKVVSDRSHTRGEVWREDHAPQALPPQPLVAVHRPPRRAAIEVGPERDREQQLLAAHAAPLLSGRLVLPQDAHEEGNDLVVEGHLVRQRAGRRQAGAAAHARRAQVARRAAAAPVIFTVAVRLTVLVARERRPAARGHHVRRRHDLRAPAHRRVLAALVTRAHGTGSHSRHEALRALVVPPPAQEGRRVERADVPRHARLETLRVVVQHLHARGMAVGRLEVRKPGRPVQLDHVAELNSAVVVAALGPLLLLPPSPEVARVLLPRPPL